MAHILMTPEGKKVAINPDSDHCLYKAPCNPPNTGTAYTAGVDVYVHRARSGKNYFYAYSWSMWQGVQHSYYLLSDNEAREFFLKKAEGTGYNGLDSSEITDIEQFFPGIFDEDA